MSPQQPSPAHPLHLLVTEPWRAGREFISDTFSRARVTRAGDGHPVVIFPGMGTDGRAVAPLRKHCQALGYTALDWGRGYNTGPQGDLEQWTEQLAQHVAKLLEPFESTATLIGWSLGGLYARELAKLLAPRVRQVITIGTPFNSESDRTNVGWLYRLLTRSGDQDNAALSERLRTPPPVPTTSIFSRTDGVVAWQTCQHDGAFSRAQDIEIESSHLGMGWNPAVLKVVADRLAQRAGSWQRYPGNEDDLCAA